MIDLSGRDFLSSLDFTPEEVRGLLAFARDIKGGRARPSLAGKVAALLFFNPSVRTRVSCESAMARFGGTGITLNPGKDTWNFECGEGVVMGSRNGGAVGPGDHGPGGAYPGAMGMAHPGL